jgi:pimeloyl-ACP methyl ester carboxylesterase
MPLQLAFEVTGEGPPVVILHGLFGSCRNWRGIAQVLSAHHRVLCVDLRNHGASPWATTMSYSEMAADVRMLIETEGLLRPVVIGHSMGGKTAMTLALESPAAVGRLVVVDIAPIAYRDRVTPYLEAMLGIDTESVAQRADAARQLSERIRDAQSVAFLMQNLVERDARFDWRLNLPAIAAAVPALNGFPAELMLRSFRGPATLIHGSHSDYVRPQDRTAMAEAFPTMRSVMIDGAGHWVHVDRPTELIAALDLAPASVS